MRKSRRLILYLVSVATIGCIYTLLVKGPINTVSDSKDKVTDVPNKEENKELPLNVYAGVERNLYGTIAPGELRTSVMGGVFYDATLTNGWTLKIGSSSVLELYDEKHNLIIMTSVWELTSDLIEDY